MRYLTFILTLLSTPASAWDFAATPVCTLSRQGDDLGVTLTYDPMLPEYVLTLSLPDGTWPQGPVFAMTFANWRPAMIQTDQHQLSGNRRQLSVRDRGFGNVLDGLEYGDATQANTGGMTVSINTTGISGAMQAFRQCETAALS